MAEEKIQRTFVLPLRSTRFGGAEKLAETVCILNPTWKLTIADLLKNDLCIGVTSGQLNSADITLVSKKSYLAVLNDLLALHQQLTEALTLPIGELTSEQRQTFIIEHRTVQEELKMYQTQALKLLDNLDFMVLVQPFVKDIINKTLFCEDTTEYKALTISTPNHVAVALWSTQKPAITIEVFDSEGSQLDALATNLQGQALQAVWESFAMNRDPIKIVYVNTENLQGQTAYCNTWIWYYVYRRIKLKETPKQIVNRLKQLTPDARFGVIQDFWNFLLVVQNQPRVVVL